METTNAVDEARAKFLNMEPPQNIEAYEEWMLTCTEVAETLDEDGSR